MKGLGGACNPGSWGRVGGKYVWGGLGGPDGTGSREGEAAPGGRRGLLWSVK